MKILIDMNLSPSWVNVFEAEGFESVHWSTVGPHNAPDRQLFDWAHTNGHIVFTHDLDFGTILAASNASGPSVVQIRSQEVSPLRIGSYVVQLVRRFEQQLDEGALITIERDRSRARLLPLQDSPDQLHR